MPPPGLHVDRPPAADRREAPVGRSNAYPDAEHIGATHDGQQALTGRGYAHRHVPEAPDVFDAEALIEIPNRAATLPKKEEAGR